MSTKANPTQKKLSPAQLWILAADGVLNESNQDPFDRIDLDRSPQACQAGLAKWWNASDKAALLKQLAWLRDGGHRHALAQEIAKVADMLAVAEEGEETGLSPHGQFIADHLPELKRLKFIAWDHSRLINLARSGFTAGYLSEKEAWHWMAGAALVIRNELTSWKDVGDDFLLGYQYWSLPEGPAPSTTRAYDRLMATNSPWNSLRWDIAPQALSAVRSTSVPGDFSLTPPPLNSRLPDARALLDKGAEWLLIRLCFDSELDALRFTSRYFTEKYSPLSVTTDGPLFRVAWKKAYRPKDIGLIAYLINLAMGRMEIRELSFETYHALDQAAHREIQRRLKRMRVLRIASLLLFILGTLGMAGVLGAYFEISREEVLEGEVLYLFITIPFCVSLAFATASLGFLLFAQKLKRNLPFGTIGQYGFAPASAVPVSLSTS